MKNIYTTIAAIVLTVVVMYGQNQEYKGQINVEPVAFEQFGDSLFVKIKYNFDGVKISPRMQIQFTPSIVAMGHTQDLPSVVVMGRNSYNIYRRELALMSKKERSDYNANPPYAVVKGYNKRHREVVDCNLRIPYALWMSNSRLDMQEYVSGCGSKPRMLAMSQLVNALRLDVPYQVIPYLTYVQPAVEAVKIREVEAEAFLDFVVNKIDIRPDYMNNPRELAKITDMIKMAEDDPALTVRSISVIGYASPEGSYGGNQKLSEGRASALVNYLVPRFDFSRKYYKVVFGGENWAGLEKMIEASDMEYKAEVLNIIRTVPVEIDVVKDMSRKKALMIFNGGKPYLYMLKEFYPSLRKAICKVEYQVKGFDVVEAAELIKLRPQNLSLNEMYLVANTYELGSEEFVDVFETAVRMFPLDETANLNAAAAALSRRDINSAEKYLAKVKTSSPEYDNAMGVLNMLKGDYDQAETYLKSALSQGIEAAKSNLAEIQKEREDLNRYQNRE